MSFTGGGGPLKPKKWGWVFVKLCLVLLAQRLKEVQMLDSFQIVRDFPMICRQDRIVCVTLKKLK